MRSKAVAHGFPYRDAPLYRRRKEEEFQQKRGKFTRMVSRAKLHNLTHLKALADDIVQGEEPQLRTPVRFSSVIHLGSDGRRETIAMQWGLADRRAKTPLERPRHMRARTETIDALPTFADGFAHARRLVLVKTFNVGRSFPAGKSGNGW